MAQLTIADVVLLEGDGRPEAIDRVRLAFGAAGVSARRPLRRLFSVRWSDLAAFDVRSTHAAPDAVPGRLWSVVALERIAGSTGCMVTLETSGGAVHRLLVPHLVAVELRERLAGWAVRAAGPSARSGVDPADLPGQAGQALGIWRAAGLGSEPLRDRGTLAYRMAVATQHMHAGRLAEAIVLLRSLLQQTVETFGAGDPFTFALRNNLAHATALAGDRELAIRLYWEVMDDADDAPPSDDDAPAVAATYARQNMARLLDPRWHP